MFFELPFTLLNFVATEVLLSLSVSCVLLCDWIVLFQNQFVGCILRVFHRVVSSMV